MDKLKSRKFWLSIAAILSAIATELTIDNDVCKCICVVCVVASTAIYNVCNIKQDEIFNESEDESNE